jgi:hypothetical protein
MSVRTIKPIFRTSENFDGLCVIIEPSGDGDKLKMFAGSTGAVALHLRPDMTIKSATEVVRLLNATIVRISEQD